VKRTSLLASVALGLLVSAGARAADMVVGFSQIGSESGWRAAETTMTKEEAKKRGVDLKFADAQQKQENQIRALRSFIAQNVDGIFLAPVVATGWTQVLREAKQAHIPVILLDRDIDPAGKSLYLAAVTSDSVHEGTVAGEWLAKTVGSKPCQIDEIEGTVGASVATNRKKGFDDVVAAHSNMKIVRSETGDFTRSQGKQVMESFIKAQNGGKEICAVYAHTDDMMIGAIQAMKEAGLKPGTDILTVSVDSVPDMFKAMMAHEANATVELTPDMAGPAFDALVAYKTKGTVPPKWIETKSVLHTAQDGDLQQIYDQKKDLGY
jgi:galactofuranose transport system substrate-binding protein